MPTRIAILSEGKVVYEKVGCLEVNIRHAGSYLEVFVSEKKLVATEFNDICYDCDDHRVDGIN